MGKLTKFLIFHKFRIFLILPILPVFKVLFVINEGVSAFIPTYSSAEREQAKFLGNTKVRYLCLPTLVKLLQIFW